MCRYVSSSICMCARLIERMIGSNRPREDKVSLIHSQKGIEFSVPELGAGNRGFFRIGGVVAG
jgi:hypothetical protein